MPAYRDAQATLRIDTLEAKLAEADSAVRARDAEIAELRSEIAELRGARAGEEPVSFIPAGDGRVVRILGGALMLAMIATTVGARIIGSRSGYHCNSSVAQMELSRLRAERLQHQQHPAALAEPSDSVEAPTAGAEIEFDRSAAMSALAKAATAAATCGVPGGVPRQGKIKVIFAPSGQVTSAEVQDNALAGTLAGPCVTESFRAARVPPFTGASVTVTKTFTVGAAR